VALDFHKLLFQPISCGAFFVRDGARLAAMGHHADYLNPSTDEDEGTVNLVSKSLQTSRRFDALKVYLTVRALGTRVLGELVDHVVALAAAAAETINDHPRLRLIAIPQTSTVLFRWEGGDEAVDEEVNAAAPRRLWDEGAVVLGRGRWRGVQVLRMTFVNPVCTIADVRLLVAKVADACEALAAHHVTLPGVPTNPDGPGGVPDAETGSPAEAAA
jgi:L-2,4-diaminobutyrate decarboxylase